MSNSHIIPANRLPSARAILLPSELEVILKKNGKGERRALANRLGAFADWLDNTGRHWMNPELAAYRDALLSEGKAPSTIKAHLSTIRSRYEDLLTDNATIHLLDGLAVELCTANNWETNPANIKAATDRLVDTIENALNPRHSRVKEIAIQDREGSEFIRLTRRQAEALLSLPGTDSLVGLRDTALIALALATGARAAELAVLRIGDHRARTESSALAVVIRDGKGGKQRVVPYGDLDFAIAIVDSWLENAGITEGAIFRGFYKNKHKVRTEGLSTVAIEQIIGKYKISIDGQRRTVKPHDLRRTYARLMHDNGMPPVAIQQNLGHASLDTTLRYIGELDDRQRQPGAVLYFDLNRLPDIPLRDNP